MFAIVSDFPEFCPACGDSITWGVTSRDGALNKGHVMTCSSCEQFSFQVIPHVEVDTNWGDSDKEHFTDAEKVPQWSEDQLAKLKQSLAELNK